MRLRPLLLAAPLLLGAPGCDSLFYGFSVLPPEEPPRPPLVVPTRERLDQLSTGDPAVLRVVEGSPHASTSLIRVKGRVAPHYHQKSDETIYVIEGEGDLLLEQEWRPIAAGDLIHVPKTVPHAFVNRAPGGTLVLSTYAPAEVEGDRVPVREELPRSTRATTSMRPAGRSPRSPDDATRAGGNP